MEEEGEAFVQYYNTSEHNNIIYYSIYDLNDFYSMNHDIIVTKTHIDIEYRHIYIAKAGALPRGNEANLCSSVDNLRRNNRK